MRACGRCSAPRWVAVLRSRFFASSRAAVPLRLRLAALARSGRARPLRSPARLPPAFALGLLCGLRPRLPLAAVAALCFRSLRCGLPAVALASSHGRPCAVRRLPDPPAFAPCGASGGLRSVAGGLRRLRRRLLGFAPGSPCPRVLRPLRFPPAGVSPLRPSRPRRPRWGLRGSAEPVWVGLRAPRLRRLPPGLSCSLSAVRPPIVAAGQGSSHAAAPPLPCAAPWELPQGRKE